MCVCVKLSIRVRSRVKLCVGGWGGWCLTVGGLTISPVSELVLTDNNPAFFSKYVGDPSLVRPGDANEHHHPNTRMVVIHRCLVGGGHHLGHHLVTTSTPPPFLPTRPPTGPVPTCPPPRLPPHRPPLFLHVLTVSKPSSSHFMQLFTTPNNSSATASSHGVV